MTEGFASEGTYTSAVLDAAQVSRFGKIQLHGSLPAGTAALVGGIMVVQAGLYVRRFGVHPLRLKHRMLSSGEPMECPFAQPSDEPSVVEDLAVEHGIPLDPRAPGDDVRP